MIGRALLAALLSGAAGCSILVSPSDRIRCAPEAESPCPEGQVCIGGLCQPGDGADAGPCEPTGEELCNGRDDDCDVVVDEGQDDDMDGFTWCGGGVAPLADCDDGDPTVHPASETAMAAEEVCDGKDNDCDGSIDVAHDGMICASGLVCSAFEGCVVDHCARPGTTITCDPGERCDLARDPPRCVPGTCIETGCTPPAVCDAASGSCVTRRPLGEPCAADVECASGVCASIEATRLSSPPRICARACCTDADCAADGAICWASGTGAKLCLPTSLLSERSRGPGASGATCSAGSECASAICLPDPDGCLGNCGTDFHCGGGTVCGYLEYNRSGTMGFLQLACVAPYGSAPHGEAGLSCADLPCASGFCFRLTDFGGAMCSQACRNGEDCPDGDLPFGGSVPFYCGYASRVGDARGDSVQICYPRNHDGTARTGATCGGDGDCLDHTCIGGRCADTCCSNDQCTGMTRCRPVLRGARWEMHCLPS